MSTPKVYWEDVKVGQEIPPFVRRSDVMHWNRFAAVNDEFYYQHMDDEAGRALGQPGAIAMGRLRFIYVHNVVRDWIGPEGFIKKIGCQYRGVQLKNDTLTCNGVVMDKRVENGEHLVDLELSIVNQRGETITPGTATVVLPSRSR